MAALFQQFPVSKQQSPTGQIAINIGNISYMKPANDKQTIIFFSKEDWVYVDLDYESVKATLNEYDMDSDKNSPF